jgi:hypothetical protein
MMEEQILDRPLDNPMCLVIISDILVGNLLDNLYMQLLFCHYLLP